MFPSGCSKIRSTSLVELSNKKISVAVLSSSLQLQFTIYNFGSVQVQILHMVYAKKWSNILKQFVGKIRRLVRVCFTILWGWHLKG